MCERRRRTRSTSTKTVAPVRLQHSTPRPAACALIPRAHPVIAHRRWIGQSWQHACGRAGICSDNCTILRHFTARSCVAVCGKRFWLSGSVWKGGWRSGARWRCGTGWRCTAREQMDRCGLHVDNLECAVRQSGERRLTAARVRARAALRRAAARCSALAHNTHGAQHTTDTHPALRATFSGIRSVSQAGRETAL